MLLPELNVFGTPYGKGSMIPMVSKSTGRAIMRPVADFELTRWSNKLVAAAADVWRMPKIDQPCVVALSFRTPRPTREYHQKDVDKLVRAVLDALTTARVYVDDSRVACLLAVRYHVSASEPLAGCRIQVGTLEDTRHVFESFYSRLPSSFTGGISGTSIALPQ